MLVVLIIYIGTLSVQSASRGLSCCHPYDNGVILKERLPFLLQIRGGGGGLRPTDLPEGFIWCVYGRGKIQTGNVPI